MRSSHYYPFPKLLFHKSAEDIHYNVNVKRRIDVMHAFGTDWVHVLEINRDNLQVLKRRSETKYLP